MTTQAHKFGFFNTATSVVTILAVGGLCVAAFAPIEQLALALDGDADVQHATTTSQFRAQLVDLVEHDAKPIEALHTFDARYAGLMDTPWWQAQLVAEAREIRLAELGLAERGDAVMHGPMASLDR
ncbi:MAG: hypothetical protein AAGK04_08220 [Planctomycetota bacterium]